MTDPWFRECRECGNELHIPASSPILCDACFTSERYETRIDEMSAEIARLRAENERLRAAIDRRPDISAEDAELFSRTSHTVSQTIEDRIPGYADAMSRIASALQGHAEKAVKS